MFRQYHVKGIGTFINVLYLTAPVMGIVMYFVNAMTFYAVANVNIHRLFPWMNLTLFIVSLVAMMLIALVLFYMFVYKSYYSFLNKQTYIHNNPMQKDLELIKKKLGIEE